MSQDFSIAPRPVSRVDTPFRRILGEFPVTASLPLLEQLRALEPLAMRGQPPVVWHRAEGFQVEDAWGNRWLDWSSGVLIANAGHGRREIADAVAAQAHALLASYCFPTEIRARLAAKLAALLPAPLTKVFLLTTGSETVECAVKLCRTRGLRHGGRVNAPCANCVLVRALDRDLDAQDDDRGPCGLEKERRRDKGNTLERLLRRLLGLDLKALQYAEGSRFVRQAVDAVGMAGFNRVWDSPTTLPTRAEIKAPLDWVARIHGVAVTA